MKKIMTGAFMGALSGIGIGTLVSLIFSISSKTGEFALSNPEFTAKFSNELSASIVAVILFAIIGIVSSVSSLVYEIDTMSFTKKMLIHLIIVFTTVSAIGYYSMWFTSSSILSFLITFILIYFTILAVMYISTKKDIDQINQRLK